MPLPPEWLAPIGIEMWERVGPWLVSSKILTDSDLANLEAYCAAYNRWRLAVRSPQGAGPMPRRAAGSAMIFLCIP